ncbi:phage holin family protein [Streptomyces capparidis]
MSTAERPVLAADTDTRTDSSLAELVSKATVEISGLVHDEIALAKAELRQDAKTGGIVGGAAAVAGGLVAFSLPVLSFAAAYGLHNLGLGLAWAFLIVGGAFLVLAAVVGLVAARAVKRISFARRSIASMKETAATFKGVKSRPASDQP